MGEGIEPPLALSYDSARRSKPMVALHYTALLCGVLPLGIGTAIFFLFLATRNSSLPGFGLMTILCGGCLAIVGLGCIGIYFVQARNADPVERQTAMRRIKWTMLLIGANFPIALVLTFAGIWAMSLITIVVSNDGTTPLDAVVVNTDRGDHVVKRIRPGTSRSVHTWNTRIRASACEVIRNGKREHHTVPSPVTASGGFSGNVLNVNVTDESVDVYAYDD